MAISWKQLCKLSIQEEKEILLIVSVIVYYTHPGETTTNFCCLCGLTVELFDTQYIDNDYHQPNMDENTNKGSWASKKRFAEAVGGRLPTIEEVRARKFVQCGYPETSYDMWVPCTNSAYDGQATDPSADYVEIGPTTSHYFWKKRT